MMMDIDPAQAAILKPFVGMLLLSFAVWTLLYYRRLRAVFANRIHPQKLTTPSKAEALIDEFDNLPAYNLRNLAEVPVFFYAACLYLFVTHSVDSTYVAAAWWFFGFRVVHSGIHCTTNRVKWRFYAYIVASLGLWFMVLRIAADLLID